ncbi:hypothetical protein QZH41_007327 [Actinostola sp. cb2023]|nr:hypothetical protein QZH41_007327 [Actinostola sp. cb2023]
MVENYSKSFHVAWIVVYIIYAVAVVVLNLLTALTITLNRHLRKRCLFCIVNLAVADTLFGMVAMPCFITQYGDWHLKWQSAAIFQRQIVFLKAGEIFPGIASLSFLVVICLERCYVTFYPFHSRSTPFKTYVVGVVITWLFAVVAAVLFIVFNPFSFLMFWLIACTSIISLGYTAIYIKIKRQNRQRRQLTRAEDTAQRERELAKTLFIVTISSVLCWVPFVVLSMLVYHDSHRVRRAIPSKPLLVGYWGQNGAGPTVGQANYEKPLKWFCENSKYDIINVAFLVTLFDSRNKDALPGLNFAFHCGGGVTAQHPFLFRCPAIENGIKACQQNKKKVLLSVGGSTMFADLKSKKNAIKHAGHLWQLFLGGKDMANLRPFGTAIMDGIDLNLEAGKPDFFPDVIRELRRLMETDSSRSYLVTSTPQCPHPDRMLGPITPGTALAGNFCNDKSAGIHPHPSDCTKFVMCVYGHHSPFIMSCPPEEKERAKDHRLADDMENEDYNKNEQAGLINTFQSLLDESEKLARNLEEQNSNLYRIISDEKERVSELRNKLSDLQDQVVKERKSNREMSLRYEHMKVEFLSATTENEGYKRDMAMIRKELDAIREIQQQVSEAKKQKKEEDDETLEDCIEDLEEKLQISDTMLQAKYLEAEKLQSDLEKTSEQVEELETKVSAMTDSITKLMETLEVTDREVGESTELLKDTQAALESEKLAKDEYIIKCELLERKLAIIEMEAKNESDGRHDMEKEMQDLKEHLKAAEEMRKYEEDLKTRSIENLNQAKMENRKLEQIVEELKIEKDSAIQDLREQLEEERFKVDERISLVEKLEEELKVTEEMRKYEEDIKTISIENINQAEMEKRKLEQIVEELKNEKDSAIQDLREQLEEERFKVDERISLVEKLEEELKVTEEMRKYEEDIKTKSIENINQAEMEKRKLEQIVEELRKEKDSAIQDLREQLEEERFTVTEKISLIEELEEQLKTSEKMRKYEQNIKTISIEFFNQAETENRKLKQIVEELRNEKDSAIQDLREQLEEGRLKVVDNISLVQKLEEQLKTSEEIRKYEEDIKTKSIESTNQAEIENRKLEQIVEELRKEKDSAIQDLREQLEEENKGFCNEGKHHEIDGNVGDCFASGRA